MKNKKLNYLSLMALGALISTSSLVNLNVAMADKNNNTELAKDCSIALCKTDDGIVVEIISKGEQLADDLVNPEDRRVEITQTLSEATKAPREATVTGNFLVRMPLGGIFWATEDPAITAPRLSVNAPQAIKFDGNNAYNTRFNYYTNYQAFIKKLTLSIYSGTDQDLIDPIYEESIDLIESFGEFSWDGLPGTEHELIAGDNLIYIIRAFDEKGNMDETKAKYVQLITPEEYDSGLYLNQASSQSGLAAQGLSSQNSGSQSGVGQNQSLTSGSSNVNNLSASSTANSFTTNNSSTGINTFGQSELIKQNIPIRGSRVRIFGQDVPENHSIEINGKSFPIDLKRKFAAEYLLPIGQHDFDLTLSGEKGTVTKKLNVNVTGKYMFLAALADLTVSENNVSGSIEPLSSDDRYDEDLLIEGRLAFYLKGKVKGKYLITAHADTQEREISKLFNGFLQKDPVDIFRRLDPDRYYPVYGDDSTTTRDVDTQGRMYVRVDWDKSLALWGNFNTGISGSELSQYNRSLYGAALDWNDTQSNEYGDPKTQVKLFASESQTAFGHSEFLGTGGSLYYLKHTDILPGSEKVSIEVRDPDSGLTVEKIDLVRDADFEIDEIQGRIILNRPLLSFTREGVNGIIRDEPIDGNQLLLLVDYEYLPTGFDANHVTSGGRVKKWLGDHVALGLTYVDENRAGDDYELAGIDLTLQAGKGTYLKIEQAQSKNTQAASFYSDNGGLTFIQNNATQLAQNGDAQSIEARVNFKELGYTKKDMAAMAWHKKTDAGFSIARRDLTNQVTEQGLQVTGQYSRTGNVSVKATSLENGDNKLEQTSVYLQQKIGTTGSIAGEVKQVKEVQASQSKDALLAAIEYRQRITTAWELYGIAQATLEADANYDNNDLFTLGTKYLFSGRSTLGAEYSTGHRGDSAALNFEYQINDEHSVYGRYSWSTDSTSPLISSFNKNGFTLGHRSRISNDLNVYNETQMINSGPETGFIHVFGMNYFLDKGWTLGGSLQHGELTLAAGKVDRDAATVSLGFRDKDLEWQSKLEYREDNGVEQREQWLTTNRISYILNDSWRLAAKYNFSDTKDFLSTEANAKFVEGSMGFAYRPYDDNRWNVLGKYTYLYDLRSISQTSFGTDQKSDIFTLEGTYRINHKWELAGKVGRRVGELRASRGEGEFFSSTVNFMALQTRYHLVSKWDGLAEYRMLEVDESNSIRKGWLIGVDRHVGDHFKIGMGYNFTDFSDDLRVTDYEYKGWFINLVGKY